MAHEPLDQARFPAVTAAAGHYESFYLKLADPARPRGAWIRYTVLKRPAHTPRGSLWCTVWSGDGPPVADKLTVDAATAPPGELIEIAGATLSAARAGSATLRAEGATATARWSLTIDGGGVAEFPYLPAAPMYGWPLPRTKAVSLIPRGRVSGLLTLGGIELAVDGWPGMLGHNWGAEHAERWVWLHGAGFPDQPEAWFDATIGRIRVGPLTLPWLANAGLWLDGRLHRLGGPRRVRIEATPERCRFALAGAGVSVRGEVEVPAGGAVAWRYSDPGGGEHLTCNCSVAPMTLTITRAELPARQLALSAGAAYELGAREPPRGIPVQRFPDP